MNTLRLASRTFVSLSLTDCLSTNKKTLIIVRTSASGEKPLDGTARMAKNEFISKAAFSPCMFDQSQANAAGQTALCFWYTGSKTAPLSVMTTRLPYTSVIL